MLRVHLDVGQPVSIKCPFTSCCYASQSHYLRSCMKYCIMVPSGRRNTSSRTKNPASPQDSIATREGGTRWLSWVSVTGTAVLYLCHQFQSARESKLQKPLLLYPMTSIGISRDLIDLSSVMVVYDITSTSNSATDMNNQIFRQF